MIPIVKINNTSKYLDNIYSNTATYNIVSKHVTINDVRCEIKKGHRCFEFKSDAANFTGSPIKLYNINYGYAEAFRLENEGNSLHAFKGAAVSNVKLFDKLSATGEIWELESRNFSKESYYRAILPLQNFHKAPLYFIESLSFNTESSERAAGLIEITINEIKFLLFDYKIEKSNYLIIDSSQIITQKEFENVLASIIYCYGLISGSLIRDEITILSISNIKEETITGFHFRRIENSTSGMSNINPDLFKQYYKNRVESNFLNVNVFAEMINCSLKDLRLYRSIKIINESSGYPLEIKASTYSVALETLKNIIIEENAEKTNPFKNKRTASKAIKELKKTISAIDDNEFNNKKSIINKLEQINQVGNSDSFLLSFELLDIALNDDDINCINMRNDFLHGRLPFENEALEKDEKDYQLQHIVYKLHFLISSLIFKKCGYNGYLLNNIKLVDLMHFKKNIQEPLFRNICTKR